jgi:hypothetical protein
MKYINIDIKKFREGLMSTNPVGIPEPAIPSQDENINPEQEQEVQGLKQQLNEAAPTINFGMEEIPLVPSQPQGGSGGEFPIMEEDMGGYYEDEEAPMMQQGGIVGNPPIYVDSRNNPRYRAYNDSLNLYNYSNKLVREGLGYRSFSFPENPKLYEDYNIPYNTTGTRLTSNNEVYKIGVAPGDYGYGNINYRDIVEKSLKTKNKPLGWTYSDASIPVYKKPTQPIKVEPIQTIELPEVTVRGERPKPRVASPTLEKRITTHRDLEQFKKSKEYGMYDWEAIGDGAGGTLNLRGKIKNKKENNFEDFKKTLPDNLRFTSESDYNLKGYWEALGKPSAFDYTQPKEEDGFYHAFSRNPNTGEILKKPTHPTFRMALEQDAEAGYNAYQAPDGRIFTFGGSDKIPEGYSRYVLPSDISSQDTQVNEFQQGGIVGNPPTLPFLVNPSTGRTGNQPIPRNTVDNNYLQMLNTFGTPSDGTDPFTQVPNVELEKFRAGLPYLKNAPLSEVKKHYEISKSVRQNQPATISQEYRTPQILDRDAKAVQLMQNEKLGIMDLPPVIFNNPLGAVGEALEASGFKNQPFGNYEQERSRVMQNRYNPYFSDEQRLANTLQHASELGTGAALNLGITGALMPKASAGRILGESLLPFGSVDDILTNANKAGKYLTEETALKNAYKLNPIATKETPFVTMYRTQKPGQTEEIAELIGLQKKANEIGLQNLSTNDKIRLSQFQSRPNIGQGFDTDLTTVNYYGDSNIRGTRGYTETPEVLRVTVPREQAELFNVKNFPEYTKQSTKRTEHILPMDMVQQAEKFSFDDLARLRKEEDLLNPKPHWLKGYPQQLPGSPNITSSVDDVGESNIINAISSTKNHLSRAAKGSKSIVGEIIGEIGQGKINRESIQKGNEWLENWINHPTTQGKIDNSIDYMKTFVNEFSKNPKETEKLLELIRTQSKNFKPDSKEFSLLEQFKDNLNQYFSKESMEPIHQGNWGVSYKHGVAPIFRDAIDIGMPPDARYGSWISRSSGMDQKNRIATTIHEGTHDWVSSDAFRKSGMRHTTLKNVNPEFKKDFSEWEEHRLYGRDPVKEMGKERAYRGYLANPTEVHARIMELRKGLSLSPENVVSPEYAELVIEWIESGSSTIDPEFLKVFDSDPKKLSNLFNKLWTVPATIGIGAGALNKANKDDKNKTN